MCTLGLALGPSRTRSDLLPYLTEFAQVENDEVHSGIAKQLGSFVDLVGGAEYAPLLLPLLEKFAAEEETVIRTSACEALRKIIPQLSAEAAQSDLYNMIQRLVDGEWFTARCSSCNLIASSYSYIRDVEQQQQLRTWFISMCHTDTPMVRKAALKALGDLVLNLDEKVISSDILPIIREVVIDDLDGMRLFAADVCTAFAKVLSAEEFKQIIPILETLQEDTSWRVRCQLAIQIPLLVKNLTEKSVAENSVVPIYAKLLVDLEAEVRLAATSRLDKVVVELKGSETVADALELALASLTNDAEPNVRLALSKTLINLCNYFPPPSASKLLVPVMQSLSQDEFYVVRRNIIADLHLLTDSGPNGVLANLVPQLLELTKDPKWRVRLAVIEKTSMLASTLGGQRMFERKLQNLIILSLADHVSAIREQACEQAAKVVAIFGARWAAERFFPQAFAIYDNNTNYLHRMTCLLLMQCVSQEVQEQKHTQDYTLETAFFPFLTQAFVDEVANVRLLASQTMLKLLPHCKRETITAVVLPALRALVVDPDDDVKYFAIVCLDEATRNYA